MNNRRLLFGAILGLQVLVYGYLILTHRLPKGHDTQSVFLLQYLFQAHGGALWLPYLAHGVVSTWFANLQSGLLQNVLLLAGGVPAGTPMLPVFYAGLFLEDLVLLLGIWKLGGRFYRTPAAQFFVTLAALGSSMWISNLYWNHRLIYAVPLVIALFLDVLETGSRPKLFLAVSLASLQLLGNAPYIPVLSCLSIALFLVVHVVLHRRRLRASLSLFKPRPVDAAWLAATGVVVAAVCVSILHGMGSIRQYHAGRNPDGTVTLDAFLTYAGSANPLRYLDFLVGITPSKDYSLYCGLFTVLLATAALRFRPGKKVVQLALCLMILLFFSMGYLGLVAMAGYYVFPPLHYFRYIGLSAPLVKLFLILLAGFGFDAVARSKHRVGFAAAAAGLLGAQLIYLHLSGHGLSDPLVGFLHKIREGLAMRDQQRIDPSGLFVGTITLSAAVAAVVWRNRPAVARLVVPAILLLHGYDVLRWRLQILRDETVPLNAAAYAVQKVELMPWIARRTPTIVGNERAATFGRPVFGSGATYDYCDAFVHRDASWSAFYVTQWSTPVDLLLRAHGKLPLEVDADPPPPFSYGERAHHRLGPETQPPAYARIIGESSDKLQVFSAAHASGSDDEIAAILNSPVYTGDVLLLSSSGGPVDRSIGSRNERLSATPKVLEFAADRIRVEVETPADGWLVYCDAWHPDWTATVDGTATTVHRANLAYKAVQLHSGRNLVEFRFRSPVRSAARMLVALASLLWIVVLAAGTVGELR